MVTDKNKSDKNGSSNNGNPNLHSMSIRFTHVSTLNWMHRAKKKFDMSLNNPKGCILSKYVPE